MEHEPSVKPVARASVSTTLRIAIVENDMTVAATLEEMLTGEGYAAHICPTAAALSDCLKDHVIDMILLDLALPDANGLALTAQIRVTTAIPVIIVSARGSEVDRIVGLEVGADDYIVKPFSVREIAARIRAVLRRVRSIPAPAKPEFRSGFKFGGWTLDVQMRRLHDPSGMQIMLTGKEFDVLEAIVSASGRVLTRNQLLEMTRRHDNDDVFDRTIDVLILRLRRKIETNPHMPKFIVTERGLGYRFNAPVVRFD